MKKHTFMLFVVMIMATILVGCSSGQSETKPATTPATKETTVTSTTEMPTTMPNTTETSTTIAPTTEASTTAPTTENSTTEVPGTETTEEKTLPAWADQKPKTENLFEWESIYKEILDDPRMFLAFLPIKEAEIQGLQVLGFEGRTFQAEKDGTSYQLFFQSGNPLFFLLEEEKIKTTTTIFCPLYIEDGKLYGVAQGFVGIVTPLFEDEVTFVFK